MNIYEPNEQDIMAWLESKERTFPASDWDYYVMNGKNDGLVLQLASDTNCHHRDFFVHCLYFLVWEACRESPTVDEKRARLSSLLEEVGTESHRDVRDWKRRAEDVLSGTVQFDADWWLDFWPSDVSECPRSSANS